MDGYVRTGDVIAHLVGSLVDSRPTDRRELAIKRTSRSLARLPFMAERASAGADKREADIE